jgi:hypothetical protein
VKNMWRLVCICFGKVDVYIYVKMWYESQGVEWISMMWYNWVKVRIKAHWFSSLPLILMGYTPYIEPILTNPNDMLSPSPSNSSFWDLLFA